MQELARWKIRPVSFGDLEGRVYDLERDVVPIQSPMLLGTLKTYFEPPSQDWNYQVLFNIPQQKSEELLAEMKNRRPFLSELIGKAYPKSAVMINKEKFPQISRMHAFIAKDKKKGIYIADLASTNGTYIAGEKVNPEMPHELQDEEIIHLGGLKDDCAKFKMYEAIKRMYALFVGVDNKNIFANAIKDELSLINTYFKALDLRYTSKILEGNAATEESIFTELEKAQNLPSDSVFLFYYTAHGMPDSITTANPAIDIDKAVLTEYLNAIDAKKIVIIDSCHAEGGWENLDMHGGMYYFSSRETEESHWVIFSAQLIEEIIDMFSSKKVIDTKSINIEKIKHNLKVNGKPQTPVRKGFKTVVF